MDDEKRKISTTTNGLPPEPGYENAPAPGPVTQSGQHTAYWVLSEEERKKGFIRPLRFSYVHVGLQGPKNPLRDLTAEEHQRYDQYKYIKFEEYPPSDSAVTGSYWTQERLDKIGKGCGCKTTMRRDIAETYARDLSFYGSTFCCGCGKHLPIAEFIWDDGSKERVGS